MRSGAPPRARPASSSGRTIGSARVLVVADADQRLLEQLHDGGQHLSSSFSARLPQIRRRVRRRIAGSTRANSIRRSYFVSSRTSRHLRMVAMLLALPRASRPVAWRWPCGSEQIQTSGQAGGIRAAGCARARAHPARWHHPVSHSESPCLPGPCGIQVSCRSRNAGRRQPRPHEIPAVS